jgi:hypothetical protein
VPMGDGESASPVTQPETPMGDAEMERVGGTARRHGHPRWEHQVKRGHDLILRGEPCVCVSMRPQRGTSRPHRSQQVSWAWV